jgi:DNA invertase Pin-like site-specific DNA recombinase
MAGVGHLPLLYNLRKANQKERDNMTTYGYVRVSTADQNEDRQMIAMGELNIPPERVYMDKLSGKDMNRPAYKSLTEKLRPGDLLYIKSIDRLGRNYEDVQNQWRVLTKERGVDIAVIDMPLLDTRNGRDLMGTFIADVVLQLLAFVAQNERETIRKRQAEGIAAARARGVHMGRPVKRLPDNFPELARQWERGKLRTIDFVAQTGLTETTLYRRLREHKAGRRK